MGNWYNYKNQGGKNMKVFISWSGELSNQIAKELSIWLPSIIQSVEVFYSPEDIKKGENWDARLTSELENSDFGIVCLTSENVMAPWIHFEAGALSKKFDSKVAAIMVDVVTSDIQGPLSRFQATKLEKEDFYKLIKDINEESGNKIDESILKNTFDAIWEKMYEKIASIINASQSTKKNKGTQKEKNMNDILEELLQLVRKQDALLNNPEKLLPIDYFNFIFSRSDKERNTKDVNSEFDEICHLLYVINEDEYLNIRDLKALYSTILRSADYLGVSRDFLDFWQDRFETLISKKRRKLATNVRKDKLEKDVANN